MEIFQQYFYHGLLIIGSVVAYFSYKKGNKQSIVLTVLLLITLTKELITSNTTKETHRIGYMVTDVFNLIEYGLLCIYFIKTCPNKILKKWVKLSIILFIIFGAYTSLFIYRFENIPILNIDMEGFLLLIIYTHLLYNLNIDENRFIYMDTDFWISIGIMIFFGGAFVFIGLLPVILKLDSLRALREYGTILDVLNDIFYSSVIIGLIWAIRRKKFSTVQS